MKRNRDRYSTGQRQENRQQQRESNKNNNNKKQQQQDEGKKTGIEGEESCWTKRE